VQDYRASFSPAELNSPAVWVDKSGDAKKRLDATIAELQKLTPRNAFFPIQDANAAYELTNLKPGAKEEAIAFKPDPAFPDFKDPLRPQVILVNFWSKSDPKDRSPRTLWLRGARETFDFAALAALLR